MDKPIPSASGIMDVEGNDSSHPKNRQDSKSTLEQQNVTTGILLPIISLLTGCKPNYNVIDKIPKEFGSYVGGFVNDWEWNNINENVSYTDEQLYDLYLTCKNSWK